MVVTHCGSPPAFGFLSFTSSSSSPSASVGSLVGPPEGSRVGRLVGASVDEEADLQFAQLQSSPVERHRKN